VETPDRPQQCIVIVDADETFPWRWDDLPGTLFTLRIVDDDKHTQLRRENTKIKTDRTGRHEVTDWNAVGEASLLHAIVGIGGLKRRVREATVDVDFDALDYAAQSRIKALLPERCKAEILRICVGKEAGEAAAAEKKL